MAQFDVHANPGSREYPFVVDLQADLLRDLATRVVAPLVPARKLGAGRIAVLNPTIDIAGKAYVVLTQEAAAVPRAALGPFALSLAHRRNDLIAALDLIFAGI
jgi:toxin CcdB